MCRAVRCKTCAKTTWAGCGQHINQVKAGVPAGECVNPPGESGDFSPWEGWSHVREYVEEVPGRVA